MSPTAEQPSEFQLLVEAAWLAAIDAYGRAVAITGEDPQAAMEAAITKQLDASLAAEDPRPWCPFCHRRFEPVEVEWLEFTPPHLSRNRLLAAQGVQCRGAGQPLER